MTDDPPPFPFRLLTDRTFFHDAWRTDYNPPYEARWLFMYLTTRQTFDESREKLLVVPEILARRLNSEFRAFPDVPANVVLLIREVALYYPTPTDISLDLAPLFVAKALADGGTVCLIISSVKTDKWIERLKRAEIDWKVEGFETAENPRKISDRRAIQQAWFVPLGSKQVARLLRAWDSRYYKKVVEIIGPPDAPKAPIGKKGRAAPHPRA